MNSIDLDALLATRDDAALCEGVFDRFDEFNNVIDVDAYSEEERVVTLALHSAGIIGNGGFEYLFAGEFNGDPSFIYTAAAFKAIEASQSYAAFQRALGLFGGQFPVDAHPRERIAIYQRAAPEEERNAIDRQFSDDDANMHSAVARYIRERRDRFRELLAGPRSQAS